MVTHACYPSTGEAKAEEPLRFKASLCPTVLGQQLELETLSQTNL